MPIEPFDGDSEPLSPNETDIIAELIGRMAKHHKGKKNAASAERIISGLQEKLNVTLTPERLRELFLHITFTTQDLNSWIDRDGDNYFVINTPDEIRDYVTKVDGYWYFFEKHHEWVMKAKDAATIHFGSNGR